MTDENGNLSIDFLAGFTIFMVAFIWVVTMIPGLMIGLQSYTIDYDAVAYRTGVILVEDPGWPVSPPWESFSDMQKSNVTRFGLALSKDTPNILSQDKVNRFFCETAFIFPDDYRTRAIFGDYPYGFNISLIDLGGQTRSRGDPLPDGHGTIRRLVKIKGTSNATIGDAKYTAYRSSYIKTNNATTHVFSILIDNPRLLTEVSDPLYQIDPSREQLTINITDLRSTITEFPPTITRSSSNISLQNIKIYKRDGNSYSNIPLSTSEYPYIDGSSSQITAMPYYVSDNVTLKFSPRFFDLMKAQNSQIYIALRFDITPASTFLNNTQVLPDYNNLDGALTFNNTNTVPFDYNYDPINVTQPSLRDAVVEVAVWSGSSTGPIGGGGLPLPNGSFTIQASAGSGGTLSPSGSVIVNNGANQTFTVSPNTGYHITDVFVDTVSQGAISTYTFTNVVQDHKISASFAINTYTITPSVIGGNGTISPATVQTVNYGATPTFTITPINAFYHIADVSVNGISVGTVTSYTFPAVMTNYTINSSFALGPGPAFTSITPNSGPTTGGTPVTIAGTNFASGGSFGVTIGGAPATGVVLVDSSHITAVTPASTAGAKDVVITNNDGQTATGTGVYTYVAPPTLTGRNPTSGDRGWPVSVTLSGTNFQSGATVNMTRGVGVINAYNVVVVSPISITCTFDLVGATAANDWAIRVTNPDSQSSGTQTFTVNSPNPTVTSILPVSGQRGTTVTITNIAGTGFQPGVTEVRFSRDTGTLRQILLTNINVISSTQISGTLVIPAGHTVETKYVRVTNSDSTTGISGSRIFSVLT
jgi:hypothetical protein